MIDYIIVDFPNRFKNCLVTGFKREILGTRVKTIHPHFMPDRLGHRQKRHTVLVLVGTIFYIVADRDQTSPQFQVS